MKPSSQIAAEARKRTGPHQPPGRSRASTRTINPTSTCPADGGKAKQGEGSAEAQNHFKMFTARATTSRATTSEIASSAIIISFIHGRIAETSVGLNAVAVANEKWK